MPFFCEINTWFEISIFFILGTTTIHKCFNGSTLNDRNLNMDVTKRFFPSAKKRMIFHYLRNVALFTDFLHFWWMCWIWHFLSWTSFVDQPFDTNNVSLSSWWCRGEVAIWAFGALHMRFRGARLPLHTSIQRVQLVSSSNFFSHLVWDSVGQNFPQ